MPSTKYEFNWERSFSGYGFPVKGPTNIHCNLPLGCEQTITDTITTSTTLSLSADIHINAGALFCGILDAANINIGHTTSREISKSISLKWRFWKYWNISMDQIRIWYDHKNFSRNNNDRR